MKEASLSSLTLQKVCMIEILDKIFGAFNFDRLTSDSGSLLKHRLITFEGAVGT
jgi:hypothetical protein